MEAGSSRSTTNATGLFGVNNDVEFSVRALVYMAQNNALCKQGCYE